MELSDDALRSIVSHYAHLRERHGAVLAESDLVEPNGSFFPDHFAVDPPGIATLVSRMRTYAPLSEDLEVELAFVEPEDGGGAGGGCGSGACSPGETKQLAMQAGAAETETGYAVLLDVGSVSDPSLLTAALSRSIGRLVLFEAGEDVDPRDAGALSELTAVACGLGLLLLRGSAVYKKGCGGMRLHQGTFLSTAELAMAVALFIRVADQKAGVVRRHLPVTQREAFDDALAWLSTQPKLVRTLREHPASLTDGIFEVEARKGLLARLFARSPEHDDDLTLTTVKKTPKSRSDEELRRLAEAKALVEEALQEG